MCIRDSTHTHTHTHTHNLPFSFFLNETPKSTVPVWPHLLDLLDTSKSISETNQALFYSVGNLFPLHMFTVKLCRPICITSPIIFISSIEMLSYPEDSLTRGWAALNLVALSVPNFACQAKFLWNAISVFVAPDLYLQWIIYWYSYICYLTAE